MLKTFVRFIFCVGTLNNFGNITKAIKQISCAISIILLLVISGLILPTDAYSSSPKVQSGINKSNVKNVKTNPSIPQKPKQIKSLKSKGIIKPTAKPFLQIKKAYVFPNDKKLRVVIQNTGGSLSSRDYMTGKLEITLLGTSTKWWWPLIKLKQKNDHFISETTFNTNKKLTEPSRVMIKIKGVNTGKPWMGTLPEQNRARKKAATVRKTAPKVTKPPKVKIDKSIKKLVPMPTKETKMVTKSTETILERGERKTLDGYPVKEWINHPIWSIPVDRSEICNIEWWVPRNFMNDDRELAGTFAVKLIKDGAVISEINSSGIAFDSSSQKCTLPWSIRNSIPDGGNYKIGIIARPPKQVKPPSFSGNQNIEGYYITNSRTFSIYDGSFQIHEPRHVGYGRSNPIDITFGVPGKFERRDGQLDATFKVELLKDGAIVAQIPVRGSSYNSSTNVFTFPWLIGPEIVNGWGYKIKVTLRPYSREYEGSFTAISRDDFGIISGTSRGSSDVFTIYSPRASERYKIGDTIPVKYTIDSPPQWGGRSPSMIKIQLEKYGSSYATNGVVHEWIEFVPERVRIDGRYNVYVNNITIPDNSSILPGTYGIIIKNPDSEHITTGFSEHFTIYKDQVTKPHIHGIRDDLLNDPFEIVLPRISLDTWIVENQQTIEWKYDPDLGDVDWTVTIDHGSNGTQVYTVEPDVIETAYNGTATARFTLPRVFGTGARAFEYSLVKVTGRLPAGPQISETRVVAIKRSIEIQVPNNSTEYLSVSENPHRVDWFVNNADVRRVNIALVNGFNRTIIGSNITVRQGYNHFEWCVFCGASIDEIKDLTGSGYTVQVIDLDNRNLFDDSATFRIVD